MENRFETLGVANAYKSLLEEKLVKEEFRKALEAFVKEADVENIEIPEECANDAIKAVEMAMRTIGAGFIALAKAIEEGAIRNKKMAKVEELMTEYMKAIDYITDKHDIDQFGGEATLYHFNDSKEKEEEETEMNVYQKFYCTGFIGLMIEMMEKDGIKNDNKLDAMMAMSRAVDIDTFKSDKGLEEIEAEMSEPEEALANVCFMLGLSDALKNLHQNEMLKDEALPDVALRLMQANEALKENRETVNNSDLEPIELTRIKF